MKRTKAERVRELRKALKLSLEKFANETDLSFSLLSKAETGAVPVTDEMLEKISNRWKVPFNWLAKGEGEFSFEKGIKQDGENPYKDYLVHTARKTFATLKREKGYSIPAIADMIGNTEAVARKHYINRNQELVMAEMVRLGA